MDIENYRVHLTALQLAHFAIPKTWPEIFLLEPRMIRARWRAGVLDADDLGRGLLRWRPGTPKKGARQVSGGTWTLTAKGRAFVERRLGAPPTLTRCDEAPCPLPGSASDSDSGRATSGTSLA